MRRFISLLLLFASLGLAAKDDNFVLRAYVTRADTTAWVALDSVAIMISAVNDTARVPFKLVSGNREAQMTDKEGEIRILVTGKPGKYMMTLDREGYEPLVKEFERKYRDQTTVWIGTVSMERERRKVLKEVEVKATAIKMVMKGDTIVYNADAFNLAEGSMLDALVRQLPNATINSAGEITVNGRKVNSLLINGKDFFSGDMDVAMKNLPSYTVKNIQVYDKAADDDYLTQASQKLDRKEDEENLVMDVVLKKEYSIGMMTSIEGGYGTSNRYLGKLFAMGFTENARISLFGNFNNLNDANSPSEKGDYWYGSSFGNGDAHIEKGGLDYNYEPNKGEKFRANGHVTAGRTTWDVLKDQAITQFYPTGDLYRRMASDQRTTKTSVNTNHRLDIRQSVLFLQIRPEFSWNRERNRYSSRTATFNSNPVESYRNEALDSVYARPGSSRYNDILLTRLRSAYLTETDALKGRLGVSGTLRFKEIPGSFSISASGSYDRSKTRKDQIYGQGFGGANTSTDAPTNKESFDNQTPETGNVRAGIDYTRKWSDVGEKRSRNIEFTVGTGYNYSHVAHDYNLFSSNLSENDAENMLPSLSCSPTLIQDLLNSYNSINNDHNITSAATFVFSDEAVERTDSGLNPSFNARISLEHNYRSNSLDYNTDEPTHESVLRRTNHFTPSAYLSFYASNKQVYRSVYINYRLNTSDPGLNLFLRNRSTGDPLVQYVYNAHNLRPSRTHGLYLYYYQNGRAEQRYHFAFNLSYQLTRDAIGNASTYDPLTGLTTYMPMNINGNWSTNLYFYSGYFCGPEKRIQFSLNGHANYTHSVDFLTTASDPERSLVKNLDLNGNFCVTYQFSNGSDIRAEFSPGWRNAHGSRAGFNTISAMEYRAGVGGMAKLPWDLELRSSLNVEWKRGYEVAEMNRAQWLWNAQVQKSILKGNLTFKLAANDILGQVKSYSLRINAQGRYETWTNNLGRHVMLSIIYRFNKSPKKRPD